MGEWSLPDSTLPIDYGLISSGNTAVTLVQSASTAFTKGAWTEIVASTDHYMDGFYLYLDWRQNTTRRNMLVDVGIGAASSEVTLISNLKLQQGQGADVIYFVPFSIPAGTRISVRGQSNAARNVGVAIFPANPTFYNKATIYARSTTFLIDLATNLGSVYDPGAVRDVKGAYVEIVASAPYDITGIMINLGNNDNTAQINDNWMVDVSVGASSSEHVRIANAFTVGSSDESTEPISLIYPVNIPAGSRLAFRAQSGTNNATDRIADLSFIIFA